MNLKIGTTRSLRQRLQRLYAPQVANPLPVPKLWYHWIAIPFVVLLLSGAIIIGRSAQHTLPSLVVAVASFDQQGKRDSGTAALLAQQLRRILAEHGNVQIIILDHPVVGAAVGAQAEGRHHRATLVVWGVTSQPTETSKVQIALTTPPRALANAPSWLIGIEQTLAAIEHEPVLVHVSEVPIVVAALERYAAGEWEETINELDSLLESISAGGSASAPDVVYRWRSLASLRSGDLARAGMDADEAIRQQPTAGHPYVVRGVVAALEGDHQQAITAYTTAIERKLTLAPVYFARGLSTEIAGDRKRALADFNAAIRHDPTFARAYTNRGIAFSYVGKLDAAITDLDTALVLNPTDLDARDFRADVYRELGQYDLALADYDRVIAQKPNYPETYGMRGNAYARMGDHARALADLERMIELQSLAFLRQGLWQTLSLRFDKARDSFQLYLTWRDDAKIRAETSRAWGIVPKGTAP